MGTEKVVYRLEVSKRKTEALGLVPEAFSVIICKSKQCKGLGFAGRIDKYKLSLFLGFEARIVMLVYH